MEAFVDHPLPWLKYMDADDLDHEAIDFDGMHVESPNGAHLGDVDGFIVDSDSGRPYYVVVDAGGWFKSKHFLLPVGHTSFDAANEVLRADLTRDQVQKFPGFDRGEFEKLSPEELRQFNDETCGACTIEGVTAVYTEGEPIAAAWDRPDFSNPEWWREPVRRSDTTQPSASSASQGDPALAPPITRDRSRMERETVVARGADGGSDGSGRAQPGDVLGVARDGEQTHVGETSEDEDRRRRDAEREVREDAAKRR
jgi:PRC-barrel domain protein